MVQSSGVGRCGLVDVHDRVPCRGHHLAVVVLDLVLDGAKAMLQVRHALQPLSRMLLRGGERVADGGDAVLGVRHVLEQAMQKDLVRLEPLGQALGDLSSSAVQHRGCC